LRTAHFEWKAKQKMGGALSVENIIDGYIKPSPMFLIKSQVIKMYVNLLFSCLPISNIPHLENAILV